MTSKLVTKRLTSASNPSVSPSTTSSICNTDFLISFWRRKCQKNAQPTESSFELFPMDLLNLISSYAKRVCTFDVYDNTKVTLTKTKYCDILSIKLQNDISRIISSKPILDKQKLKIRISNEPKFKFYFGIVQNYDIQSIHNGANGFEYGEYMFYYCANAMFGSVNGIQYNKYQTFVDLSKKLRLQQFDIIEMSFIDNKFHWYLNNKLLCQIKNQQSKKSHFLIMCKNLDITQYSNQLQIE